MFISPDVLGGVIHDAVSFTSFLDPVPPHLVQRYTPPYKTTLWEWWCVCRLPTAYVILYSLGRQEDDIKSFICSALVEMLQSHFEQYNRSLYITQLCCEV